MISLLLDHLWQSTLFAAAAGLLTLAFRVNSAAVRYWLWFAASVKFLTPFSLLTALGAYLFQSIAPKVAAPVFFDLEPAAEPFSGAGPALAPSIAQGINLAPLLFGLWVLGFAVTLAMWIRGWLKLRAALADASPLSIDAPMPVKSSTALLEPGLVGIWRPVLILPQGIVTHLSPLELRAVLVHEYCHLRRRDNLLAAVHMLVEALFWFHPLIWWLGIRLILERENACDEAVLASGTDPQTYAQGILKVCQFYLHAPLDCASGISGSDLKKRIRAIMERKFAFPLSAAKKGFLAACATIAIATPLGLGMLTAQPASALMSLQTIPSPEAVAESRPVPRTEVSLAKNIQAAPARRLKNDIASRGTALRHSAEGKKPGQEDDSRLGSILAAALRLQVTMELRQMENQWPVKSTASKSISPGETELAPSNSSPVASPSPAAAHGVREDIAQLLREAQLLSNAVHPDKEAVMEKIKEAKAMPNLNRDEKIRVAFADANLLGSNRSDFDAGPILVNGPPLLFGGTGHQLGLDYSYSPPGDVSPKDPIQ
jgi:beta-lactamase regulating signal transducer with metallopeptidase domain